MLPHQPICVSLVCLQNERENPSVRKNVENIYIKYGKCVVMIVRFANEVAQEPKWRATSNCLSKDPVYRFLDFRERLLNRIGKLHRHRLNLVD